MPDIEISSRLYHIVKSLHKRGFCGLVEVDHNIAAEDKVKGISLIFVGHRVHQVEGLENNLVLYRLAYLIIPVAKIVEVTGFPIVAQTLHAVLVIYSLFSLVYNALRDIRRENTRVPVCLVPPEILVKQHSRSVAFLSARAGGAPYAEGFALFVLFYHIRQYRFF